MRVNTNIKTIEVNDQGDSITLNLNDATLTTNLLTLIGELDDATNQIASRAAGIDGTPQERLAQAREAAAFNLEICTTMKNRVDEVLGADTCRKVFGDIVPGIPGFADFFAQLGALIREFNDELTAGVKDRVSKYTDKYHK